MITCWIYSFKSHILLKLYSPASFYFFNVTTRKLKIINVASISGSHYLSIGQRCYRDTSIKDKNPPRMKAHTTR